MGIEDLREDLREVLREVLRKDLIEIKKVVDLLDAPEVNTEDLTKFDNLMIDLFMVNKIQDDLLLVLRDLT